MKTQPSESPISLTNLPSTIRGNQWQIYGSGGSGGGKSGRAGGKSPVEDPNSLRATSTVSVLYLLGEGEIEGTATGDILRDVYLDETPIKNADGTFNFQNVQLDLRTGTQGQTYMPGFANVESEVQVGVKVSKSLGAIVRTINDANADVVVVTLSVPQLQVIEEKTGNIKGSTINFRIEISTNGGAFSGFDAAIAGKTTSNYERSYRIPLPKPGTTWQIRVTRLTNDSNSTKISDELYWKSYKQVVEAKLRYPNSALLGMKISAEQFQSIPKVSVAIKGIKCLVPSNYDPIARTYTGFWNGTFKYAWTNNPAWIFYDLLTETRYGCGDWINASQVRIDQLYAIGQYCDQLVPDGRGGMEPRFTCNCYIQNREEAYKVLDTLASVFRGMIYWGNGSVQFTQDAPATPIRLYNEANTVQEVDDRGVVTQPCFTYSGTSRKARHTVALVSWMDKSDFYKTKVEYVEDREGISRYGYREVQVTAFGCTSQGQANRVGRWLLYTERYETEIVNFTIGTEGLLCRPGELIKIHDPGRAGIRTGGRILAATTTQVTLDSPITIAANQIAVLGVQLPDGTITERYITNGAGTHTVVNLNQASSVAPSVGAIWGYFNDALYPQVFRVIAVTEKGGNQYAITALEHNPSKFDAIEQGIALQTLPITALPNLNKPPLPPSNISITESLYESGAAGIRTRVAIGFAPSSSPGIDRYQIEYRLVDDPAEFRVLNYSNDPNAEWLNAIPGNYAFRVCAINKLGLQSEYAIAQKEILGLATPPSSITGATLTVNGDRGVLRWDLVPDLDVRAGGAILVKATTKTSNITWADGFDVAMFSGTATVGEVPLNQGYYMLKAIDSTGIQSANFALVDARTVQLPSANAYASIVEEIVFNGAKSNTINTNSILKLSRLGWIDSESFPGETFDGTNPAEMWDTGEGDVCPSGTYEFPSAIDLGANYTVNLTSLLTSTLVDELDLFDAGAELWDSNENFDGGMLDGVNSKLQIATSTDGVSYSAWGDFYPGDYQARSIKTRILLTSTKPNYNVYVSKAGIYARFSDRSESDTLNTAATASTITYSAAFINPPIISVSIENAASGDYYQLSSQSRTGFAIVVKDGSGANVIRKVVWTARGIGRQLT